MRFLIFVLFIIGLSFPSAAHAAQAENETQICIKRLEKKNWDSEKKQAFCHCWIAAYSTLSKREKELLRSLISGKTSVIELEKINYPLSEFAYQIDENCLFDSQWRLKK